MRIILHCLFLSAILGLARCSKIEELGSRFFSKSGTVFVKGKIAGLSGQGLVLSINGQNFTPSGATVAFESSVKNGDTYAVTVVTQPVSPVQVCTFTSGGSGVVRDSLVQIELNCALPGNYTIGGSISGLTGSGLQLQLNNGEILAASGTGFSFTGGITSANAYNVQVKVQPSSPVQICTPQRNVGIVTDANVTDVSILCSTVPYSVGGYVNGLASGQTVTLQVNGGQNTVRSSDGFFLFPTPLADQTNFDVTVLNQPTGQTCSVQNGSAVIDGRGSYATYVQCSSSAWAVSGIVSGLNGGYVTLVTSAGEYKPVVANGAFSFTQKFASGSAFAVEVFRNPALPTQTCTVMNGTGTNISADVGSVSVVCSSAGYTVGGPVTGLIGSGLVLRLNGTSDVAVPIAASSYTFSESVASGGLYSVAIAAQPTGLKCTATPATASGTVSTANVTNVAVSCVTGYTVGGTVTGLNGTNLVLRNTVNGGTNSDFVISGSTFTFPELLFTGDTYSVQILNHPESPYQTCGASNSGGTVASSNITNITISCTNVVVQFSSAASSGLEAAASPVDIPITITPASARPLVLTLALAAGTASSGVDFNFLTPTINVPVGANSVNAQIQVFDDSVYEPNETVKINLTGVDKAALGSTQNYTYTINNDDSVAATKLVVTNSGSNFTAGGSTSITIQVQDASNNVATTDSSTQITFTPNTATATIASMTTGSGCAGCGAIGGTAVVTVQNGVATVVLNDTKAESFQISVSDSGPLTDPLPVSLTTSAGVANKITVTSAPGPATAGGTSTMTVQVQDVNGNLVTSASTLLTITPSSGGTITGVTTGSGDGGYGVPAGTENISVSGGVATITLTNTVAQTYSISITNGSSLINPSAPNVTVSAAAASQLVLSSSAPDFLTGGTSSLTVQVRDTYGNVLAADGTTEVTFTPSSNGRITNQTTGIFVSGSGSAGVARVVRVVSGVATVTIENSVSETFTVSFAAGSLSVPSPDSITTSAGATKIAITQAGGSFISGGTTTLTVQVQTASNTLVNTDNSTVITFTPNNSASITATTGTHMSAPFDGANAAENIRVVNGVATITLSSSTVGTFQVSISDGGGGLADPPDDSITVTGASGATLTKAEYFDLDHDGKIEHVKLTFNKNVNETGLSGSMGFSVLNYLNVVRETATCNDESYPTNSVCTDPGESVYSDTDNIVWLRFDPGPVPDTGATPELTGSNFTLRNVAAEGSCYIHTSTVDCNTQANSLVQTTTIAETDKAPPVFVTAWSDPIVDAWQLRIQFSEAVDLTSGVGACSGTVTSAAFTYNNVGGSGASALRTDFADNNGCDSTGGYYYIIPRVNARFTYGDLRTDTLALATTFYDAVGLATVAATKTIQYDPNLELYYPMDAAAPVSDTNSLVHDVTANGRNGNPSGGAKLVRDMADNNNQAYYFDGTDDQITVTGYTGINGNAARSISLWVQTSYPKTTNSYFSWGTNSTNQKFSFGHDPNSGEVYFHSFSRTKSGQKRIVDGGWHHVAITFSNDGTPEISDLQFYVDGVAVSQSAITNDVMNTIAGSNVLIGRDLQGGAWLRGKLDEVRLYSRALSASEIKKLATKVPGGLVAQYPLDNTGIDQAGNGFDSAPIGGPTAAADRYGISSSAYTLNGTSNYFTAGDNTLLRATTGNSITLSAWINPNTFGVNRAIVAKGRTGGANDANYALRCFSLDQFNFYFQQAGSYASYRATGTSACSSNTWSHVLATFTYGNASSAKLYVNGSEVAATWTTGTGTEIPDNSSAPLNIGAINDGALKDFFSGQIDDVRIYNRALTAGEVAALATELDRGLVSYYPLDDAAATAKDYSGSGNDLTAVNGPTYVADRNGITNAAFSFNSASTQYLTTSSAANLPQSSANRTVCAWVKGGQPLQSVASHGGTGATGIFNLKIHSNYGGPAVTNSQTMAGVESPLIPPNYGWYHLCGLVGNASSPHQVLVNGFLEASSSIGFNSTGTELRIGANTLNGQTWNGSIDDARIYDRALSVAEIRALSGFYPAHVADLKVWFDAGRVGVAINNNDDVDNWKDLSLSGNDGSRSGSGSAKPNWMSSVINGQPAVNWPGGGTEKIDINNYTKNLNTTPHTQLAAFRASGGGAITGGKASRTMSYRYDAGPVLKTEIGSGATSSTAYVNNTWMIGGLSYSNPSGTFYKNGISDGTFSQVAASNTSGWTLGSSDSGTNPVLTGDIAEIVMYDRVLTASEFEKVNCYYNKKYAIAVTGLVCD